MIVSSHSAIAVGSVTMTRTMRLAIADLLRGLSTRTIVGLDYVMGRRSSTLRASAASGCPTFVSVMEAADFCDGGDNAFASDGTWNRGVLGEREMRSRSLVVATICLQ